VSHIKYVDLLCICYCMLGINTYIYSDCMLGIHTYIYSYCMLWINTYIYSYCMLWINTYIYSYCMLGMNTSIFSYCMLGINTYIYKRTPWLLQFGQAAFKPITLVQTWLRQTWLYDIITFSTHTYNSNIKTHIQIQVKHNLNSSILALYIIVL